MSFGTTRYNAYLKKIIATFMYSNASPLKIHAQLAVSVPVQEFSLSHSKCLVTCLFTMIYKRRS